MEVDDYQLDPVVRALSMPRVNLRSLLMTSVLARPSKLAWSRRNSSCATVPAAFSSFARLRFRCNGKRRCGTSSAWTFGSWTVPYWLIYVVVAGIHVNPWAHFPRLITSIDFLKRDRPMRLFRGNALPAGDQPTYPAKPYDLLIVDEAHNVAPSGRGKYATDSLRTSAIKLSLVPFFEHIVVSLGHTTQRLHRKLLPRCWRCSTIMRFASALSDPNRTQLDAVMRSAADEVRVGAAMGWFTPICHPQGQALRGQLL